MDHDTASVAARNKQVIRGHFEALINNKDLDAITRNLLPAFYDHDGPGGRTDASAEIPMIKGLHDLMPDIKVEVRDAIAEGDKVVVRNVWSGTNAKTGQRMECHGFVLWRLEGGKIAERWATVTSFKTLETDELGW